MYINHLFWGVVKDCPDWFMWGPVNLNFTIIARIEKRTVKQLFHIEQPEAGEQVQKQLLLSLGEAHCSFAITNVDGTKLYKLFYYAITAGENALPVLLEQHQELNDTFYKVLLSYDHPQSTLVPWSQFRHEEGLNLLRSLYGINGSSTVISESIGDWQLYNVFAVPSILHELVSRKYPAGQYWHLYSAAIKNIHAAEDAGHLLVDFRKNDFIVVAVANGQLLLTQTFLYSTPEDVLYYLLKTVQQLGLSQQEVKLSLSGLIDKQSALYKELYQYFLHLEFREAAWEIVNSDYPAHFFTSLNDLVKCAS